MAEIVIACVITLILIVAVHVHDNRYEVKSFDSNYARLTWLHDRGYIDDGGMPLKCMHCKNDNLKKVHISNVVYEESWGSNIPVEYDILCPQCKKVICHYAYGSYVYD